MSDSSRPKELYIDEKWDRVIDLTLRRVVYGGLAGTAAAILLFRGPSVRAASIAFGAGCGVGSSLTQSQKEFGDLLGTHKSAPTGQA